MFQPTTAVVVKNAPVLQLAQKLVNELLSPRLQKVLVEQMNGAAVNKTISVTPEQVAAGALDPTKLAGYVRIDTDAILKNRRRHIEDAVRILGQ